VSAIVRREPETTLDAAPVLVFSADSHIGPRKADLRPYCPKKYLDEFDDFYESVEALTPMFEEMAKKGASEEAFNGRRRNLGTAGHYDPHARLRDYDRDGVAGGVIFHASLNDEPMPFDLMNVFANGIPAAEAQELAGVGRSMYNRFLADFCTVEPERHVALAQLPFWDLDASIREVEWCADHGFRGVNFPVPGAPGRERPYGDEFDGFFSAAAALDMTLTTHNGARPHGFFFDMPADFQWGLLEAGEWGLRTIYMTIIFGVFERHPNLKLVLTEIPGIRWEEMAARMDSIFLSPFRRADHLPRLPSEYLNENVWIGCSFMSREEAQTAIEIGREDRCMWGSDYPHPEGTFSYSSDPAEYPMTRLSLANTFHDLSLDKVRKMVGTNAFDAYPRLDRPGLQKVAERVGFAAREISTAPDLGQHPYITNTGTMGFRTRGAWGP